jgi:hypothetical protein
MSEDIIEKGSPLNQLWTHSRALRLFHLTMHKGMSAMGWELVKFLGCARDNFDRYDFETKRVWG